VEHAAPFGDRELDECFIHVGWHADDAVGRFQPLDVRFPFLIRERRALKGVHMRAQRFRWQGVAGREDQRLENGGADLFGTEWVHWRVREEGSFRRSSTRE